MPLEKGAKELNQVEHEGVTWIEIGAAARLSKVKAAAMGDEIAAGKIQSHNEAEWTYIPLSAANRLKREAGLMAKVKRLNKKRTLPPARNPGLHTDQTQDVLPISSGRSGRGWLGQKPKQ
jgi:hypothetical protein